MKPHFAALLLVLAIHTNSLFAQQTGHNKTLFVFGIDLSWYNVESDDLAIFSSEHTKIYPTIGLSISSAKGVTESLFFPYYRVSAAFSTADRGIYDGPKATSVFNVQGYLGMCLSPLRSGVIIFSFAGGLNYLYLGGADDLPINYTSAKILYANPQNAYEEYWNSLPRHSGTYIIKGFPSYSRIAFGLNIGTYLRMAKSFGVYFHYTPVFFHTIRHDLNVGIAITSQ